MNPEYSTPKKPQRKAKARNNGRTYRVPPPSYFAGITYSECQKGRLTEDAELELLVQKSDSADAMTQDTSSGDASPRSGKATPESISIKKPKKVFSNKQEAKEYVQKYKSKYKTELCKNWIVLGHCPFLSKCSFAHGYDDINAKNELGRNFKTRACVQFHKELYCSYGDRCQFLHVQIDLENPNTSRIKILEENSKISTLRQTLGGETDCSNVYLNVFSKKDRLPVFGKICPI